MKKILGVVGSYRKQGNTELFVKLALMEAEKYGVKTEMIRLTDFTFKVSNYQSFRTKMLENWSAEHKIIKT